MTKLVLFSVFSFFLPLALHAQNFEVDPRIDYRVMRTRHFDILFNANQQSLAEHYAARLEKSVTFFQPFISTIPEKTVVVINDKTDQPNGYSTRLPYPHMMLYPVVPGNGDSLSEYNDWALEFVAHEYTHILTFEPGKGLVSHLRTIFGTVISPNILLPLWWKEGVAVEMETQISGGGRLRSKYQEALTRVLSDEQLLDKKSIDLVNENLPEWPEGMHPYVFGSFFFSQAVAEKKLSVVDQLLQAHGSRVPYFIESPAYEFLSRDYESFYNKSLSETHIRALRQITTIREYETTKTDRLDQNWIYSAQPAFNAKGDRLALVATDSKDEVEIQFYKLNENQWEPENFRKTPNGSISHLQFMNQSNRLLYVKLDTPNRLSTVNDIYLFDLDQQKSTPLTKNERAREPAPSLDDQEIAYIRTADGITELKVLNLATRQSQVILKSDIQERLSNPTWLNHNEILFVKKLKNKNEQLFVIHRETKALRLVHADHTQVRMPLVKAGQIFFVSAKNGVYNLYSSQDHFKKDVPLTNTLSIVLSFDYNPTTQQLAVTELTSSGPQVHLIESKEWQSAKKLAQVSPMFEDRYQATSEESVKVPPVPFEIEEYNPWPYLWPHYWIPFIATSNNGLFVQALTSSFDPLKKHSYSASVNYDSYVKEAGWNLVYQNTVWPLPWSLANSRMTKSLGSSSNLVTTDSFVLTSYPDSWWIQKSSLLGVGWDYSIDHFSNEQRERTGPFAIYAYKDFSLGKRQVSPLHGYGYSLIAQHQINNGHFVSYTQNQASAIGFLSPEFFWSGHALMGKVSSSYIGDEVRNSYGPSTSNFFLVEDTVTPTYVVRGYNNGQFFGRVLNVINLEYRFPILNIYKGKGTDPYFFERIRGALTTDALSMRGLGLEKNSRFYYLLETKDWITSSGVEVKLDMRVGYILPLTISLGYYTNQKKDYSDNNSFALNLLIGNL